MIRGLHHFSLTCSDADRSLAFYRDLFGLRLVSDRWVERGSFVEKVTGVRGAVASPHSRVLARRSLVDDRAAAIVDQDLRILETIALVADEWWARCATAVPGLSQAVP